MIDVEILNQEKTMFEGVAMSVILPGDEGEFEVLTFHWPIVSLLTKGEIVIDQIGFHISRGIAKFEKDKLTALVEL
jgi:F-type H+-transporting ATPase subunit epsilon